MTFINYILISRLRFKYRLGAIFTKYLKKYFLRIIVLLIIASYRNGDCILALPGKVQRFGSYQRRLHYRRFYFARWNFFLLLHCTSFADSRFTFVIFHLYAFTVDSQSKRHLLHLCNKRTLIIYAYFFFPHISLHISRHIVYQQETSSAQFLSRILVSLPSREDKRSPKTFQIRRQRKYTDL